MKELFPMYGIITTVLTPFNEDKSIDLPSFRKGIQAALDGGVAGFLVPCNASEMPLLSWEERKLLAEETVKIAKGKALVIPSVSDKGTDMDVTLQCREYLDLGVDGININITYQSDEQYLRDVEKVDALKPPFIVLQDASMVDDGLSDDLIVRCFEEFETVRCIKIEVENSGPKYSRIYERTGGKMNISGAWGSSNSIEAYDRGIHAMMPSGLFELFVNVYKLYHEKSRDAAKKLFFDMLPIISFTRQDSTLNRHFHKLYLKRIGVFENDFSREGYLFDEYHEKYANELIDYALALRDRIPEYWK